MGALGGRWMRFGALWSLVVLAGVLAFLQARPPRPVDVDAPPTSFSADRAWEHLEAIARTPHPVGSEEHDRVRDHLIATLRGFGYRVEVQSVPVAWPVRPGTTGPATGLDNLAVRLDGVDSTGAVMLATHYDSVWTGPGATDAGVSVAALVETARALMEHGPARNDVIILLTDAEEAGLVGARAFVDEHPWADDVEVVLNFEGRGVSGPAVVYELVDPTTTLIEALVHHGPDAVSSPLVEATARDDYRGRISDVAEFRRLGISGIGFAILGDSPYYHTPLDDLDHASRASLQHMGEAALSLARHLGGLDLSELDDGDDATWWAGLPGLALVAPSWVAWPMLAGLAAIAVAIAVRVRPSAGAKEVAIAFGSLAATGAAAALVGSIGVVAIKLASSDARTMLTDLPVRFHQRSGDLVNGPVFLACFLAAALAAAVTIIYLAEQRVGGPPIVLAATISGLVLLTGLALYHPPSAGHLLVPFLFAAGAGWVWVRRSQEEPGLGTAVVLGILGMPAAATFVSLAWLGYLGLTLHNVGQVTGAAAVVTGSLAPQLLLARRTHRWLVPLALAGIALVLLVVGVATRSTDAELVRFAETSVTPP